MIKNGLDLVYMPYFAGRHYVSVERHHTHLPGTVASFSTKGARVFVYSDVLENDTLKQLGLFYTIKINYRKDENFSLAEIVPINESKH